MKFRDGYMIKSGDPVNNFIDVATRHLQMKQGVLGIKVKIMLPYEPRKNKAGSKVMQPDVITVRAPTAEKDEPQHGGHHQQQQQGFAKNVDDGAHGGAPQQHAGQQGGDGAEYGVGQ
jgi:small subunit ribosomal protein S3e